MMKKVLGILAMAAIMFSCGNMTEKSETVSENEVVTMTVDQVMTDLQNLVGKEIVVEGVVNHVCKHGGKRMFIMGADPDVAIKITPNEQIGVFEQEYVGSSVVVTGVVQELRINEEYVLSLENESPELAKSEALHDHSAGTHDEEEDAEADAEKKAQIQAMRDQIAETENGYYSQYWVEAVKFEIIEAAEMEAEHAEGEEGEGHDEDSEHEHAEGEEHSH